MSQFRRFGQRLFPINRSGPKRPTAKPIRPKPTHPQPTGPTHVRCGGPGQSEDVSVAPPVVRLQEFIRPQITDTRRTPLAPRPVQPVPIDSGPIYTPGMPLLPEALPYTPQWNVVALFFNLEMKAEDLPAGYATTTLADALTYMDEGPDPISPPIQTFVSQYWGALSYGAFCPGLETIRDANGQPRILTLEPPDNDPMKWRGVIEALVKSEAEAIWIAGGRQMKGQTRWIPAVSPVFNYDIASQADFETFGFSEGGNDYLVEHRHLIRFNVGIPAEAEVPGRGGRNFWGVLVHELAHNFLHEGDYYGPSGCTGYWDILGDNSAANFCSELSSMQKERAGWLQFKKVLNGTVLRKQEFALRPYSETGEAYKVVPDPYTPHEYFLLEYRKSTGDEVWRPDGGLEEKGLLILHINERLHLPPTWLNRLSPHFKPEFADAPDPEHVDWSGLLELNGKLWPQPGKTEFTASSTPNSNLYGNRASGLSITNIRIEDELCKFDLEIAGQPRVAWDLSADDVAVAGRFTEESLNDGEELFIFNKSEAALLQHDQGQWVGRHKQWETIGDWWISSTLRPQAADFDGDGRDEIMVRHHDHLSLLKWDGAKFDTPVFVQGRVGDWNLGPNDWETVGDFDGDGRAEIFIRSPNWAGLLQMDGGRMVCSTLTENRIGDWELGTAPEYAGRFTHQSQDQILIQGDDALGLIQWNERLGELRLVSHQKGWIDGWNLGAHDRIYLADLDGDGRDEIFIRSAKWAGVMKWMRGRFQVIWMVENEIPRANPNRSWEALSLSGRDQTFAGRFRSDRDGILTVQHHGEKPALYLLVWNGERMEVQHYRGSPLGFTGLDPSRRWTLSEKDRFVLGDFHRMGSDIADTDSDYTLDGLTDIFIHNGRGSVMMGVNHGKWGNPNDPDDVIDQFGMTWHQWKWFMYR